MGRGGGFGVGVMTWWGDEEGGSDDMAAKQLEGVCPSCV